MAPSGRSPAGPEPTSASRSAETSACALSLEPFPLNVPSFRRARMRFESLRAAEPHGVLDQRPRPSVIVDAEPGAHTQERVHREPAGRARGPAGRQHVIRAGAVIAQYFRGPRADEQCAVVSELRGYCGRLTQVELQVLGCDRV